MSQPPNDSKSSESDSGRSRQSRDDGRDYFTADEADDKKPQRDSRDSRGPRGRDDRDSRGPRGRDSGDSRGGDSRGPRGPRGRDDRDSRGPRGRDSGSSRGPRGRDDRDSRGPRGRDSGGSRGGDSRGPRGRDDRGRDSRGPRDRQSPGQGRNEELDDSYYRQGPRKWGSLGRKGAASMHREDAGPRPDEDEETIVRPPNETDEWIDEGSVAGRGRRRKKSRAGAAAEPTPRISLSGDEAVGLTDNQRRRFEARLNEAAEAYASDRLGESKELLSSLVDRFPSSVEVRELLGLTFYRLGNWKLALKQLERFQETTHSYEQHHVIADCYRALGQHVKVASTWEELREASPNGEIVTEGRIVASGSLADKGDIVSAIRLLQKGPTRPKRAKSYTYRLWYAIADLHEQAGDLPAAREQFRHLATQSPEFGDVQDRLDALS